MSLWSRISDALAALAQGEGLAAIFDKLRTAPERSVAFTIAVIALSAKMAKADGLVTRDEVMAFREVFHISPNDERAAARVFSMFRVDGKPCGIDNVLCDLMEGLFHIAAADGDYHPNEDVFLERVAEIFGMTENDFYRMRARHVPNTAPDPYTILGVGADMPFDDIRAAWRAEVRATHPDRMLARGVPPEAVKLAEKRLVAINRAWEEITKRHAQ